MRIRSTKPEFWRSERVASVDWDARLVLKGLESYVDDNGVGKDDLALICGDIFMRDLVRDTSRTLARVSEAISTLSGAGLVHRYEVDGTNLLYIAFWESVQRIDHAAKGRLPRPDGTLHYGDSEIRDTLAKPREASRSVAPGTGEQGNSGTVGGSPDGPTPNCKRHPDGTDQPCGACKRARIAFDAQWEAALKEKPSVPVVVRAPMCSEHPEWPLPCEKCARIAAEVA